MRDHSVEPGRGSRFAGWRVCLVAVCALSPSLATAAPPELRWPPRWLDPTRLLPAEVETPTTKTSPDDDDDDGLLDDYTQPDAGETLELPRFRVELWGRASWLLTSKFKKGPEKFAHTFAPRRDAHVPGRMPLLGYRFLLDVKVHQRLLFGAYYTRLQAEGPRRTLHFRGITIQSRFMPGRTPTRTLFDIQVGEGFIRYVVRDNETLRLSVGLGVLWASMRVRLSSRTGRTDGRVEDFLYPTFSYFVSAKVLGLTVFLESATAIISPRRFPSYTTEGRAGLRIPLGGGVELILGGSLTSAQIEDVRDLWGGRARRGHRWNQGSWTALGADVGMAARF